MAALEASQEANSVKKRCLQELLDSMLEHGVPRVAVIDPKTAKPKWLEITEGEPKLRSRKAEAGELVESPADRRRRGRAGNGRGVTVVSAEPDLPAVGGSGENAASGQSERDRFGQDVAPVRWAAGLWVGVTCWSAGLLLGHVLPRDTPYSGGGSVIWSARRGGEVKARRNLPLRAKVSNGTLTIEIGVDTLACAALASPFAWELANESAGDRGVQPDSTRPDELYRISNSGGFAVEVQQALTEEREDGSSLLTDMLDAACQKAHEDGSEYWERVGEVSK